MPRARSKETIRQTAAAYDDETHSSGCLSFMLPPLAVLLVGALLTAFAFNPPIQSVQAQPISQPITQPTTQPIAQPTQPVQLVQLVAPVAPIAPITSTQISVVFTPEVQYWAS